MPDLFFKPVWIAGSVLALFLTAPPVFAQTRNGVEKPRAAGRLAVSASSAGEALPIEDARRRERSIWKISFQLGYDRNTPAFARYSPLWKLPYAQEAILTKSVLERIIGLALAETKLRKVGLLYGPGGYKRFPLSPCAQLDVLATREETRTLEETIGYLARQNEVIASQLDPDGDKPAFQIVQRHGHTLHDPTLLQRVWNRIGEIAPKLQQGFLPLAAQNQPGIRIINTEEAWDERDYSGFTQAIAALEKEFALELATERQRVNFDSVINDWKTAANGSTYLDALRARGQKRLADRLQGEDRERVAGWLRASFERYGSKLRGGELESNSAALSSVPRRKPAGLHRRVRPASR